LSKVPTYSVVYGAFATVPILLIWIYVAWVIVLLGAALTAYAPSLIAGRVRKRTGNGWQFQLALEVLSQLRAVRNIQEKKGLAPDQLCLALEVDFPRLEPILEVLTGLDWIGQLNEALDRAPQARLVLLIDPQTTALAPLMEKLLLPRSGATEKFWSSGVWDRGTLGDVI
jgi:membrane protein